MSNPAFDRWWQEWAARNEALYVAWQRERELAVARRWAQAHLDFHFGKQSQRKEKDNNGNGHQR